MLAEKFDIQVDEDTITQLTLLHSDILSYDLPAIDFMSPSEEAQESHILEEQDAMIYTHLQKVLIHMIDEQDGQIFKSCNDYVKNSSVFKIHRNMAICVSYLLIHSFSMWHSSYSDFYHILSKVPQDNAGYACSLYNYEHIWHIFI